MISIIVLFVAVNGRSVLHERDQICRHGRCDCPYGWTRWQKRVPLSNGCGSEEINMTWAVLYGPDRSCCDDHDKCYSTAGRSRDQCDDDFYYCLSWMHKFMYHITANQGDEYYYAAQLEDVKCIKWEYVSGRRMLDADALNDADEVDSVVDSLKESVGEQLVKDYDYDDKAVMDNQFDEAEVDSALVDNNSENSAGELVKDHDNDYDVRENNLSDSGLPAPHLEHIPDSLEEAHLDTLEDLGYAVMHLKHQVARLEGDDLWMFVLKLAEKVDKIELALTEGQR